MNIDLTQIALAIIALVSSVLTYFVVPWLKAKFNVENGKITENQAALLKLAVNTAVRAAEQIYRSDEGDKKKSYVLALLESQGYKIDSAALDAAVESAVLELHRQLEVNE